VENVLEAVAFDPKQYESFVDDGLIRFINNSSIEVTEDGRFFIRNIAAQFDPNLRNSTKRFSKAL
ncbi:MAG TPA: coproporphyrinogen III oxidase, partial [Mariniphaga sp.]|nr:coproporphyrinogen III oxidase [Mariniphaga sp.]